MQIEQMRNSIVEKFIKTLIIFLEEKFPDWKQKNKDADIYHFIRRMLDFSAHYEITKESNVRKLIGYQVKYQFNIPLHKKLEDCLVQADLHEDYRMERFYCSLSSSSYKLIEITSDSDLNNLNN